MHREREELTGTAADSNGLLVWTDSIRCAQWSLLPEHPSSWCLWTFCLMAALAAAGCGHEETTAYTSVSKPPTVRLTQPQVRTITRTVGQPSFVVAYERTSVYPQMTASSRSGSWTSATR